MTAKLAGRRRARAGASLVFAAALSACASAPVAPPGPPEVLLESFRSGQVRLDCARCRYDFHGAQWLLEDGHYDPLVLGILRSGDGSGRSWYLLGRVAEATGSPELAILYYRESLATSRQPIVAMWPLYEDVNYRMRRLMAHAPEEDAPSVRAQSGPIEKVNVESLVVSTRPGSVGAFMEKLDRGESVEVLDRSGDWEQIRLADGRVGWVWDAYTSVSGEPYAPVRRTSKRVAPRAPRKPEPPKPLASKPAPPPVAAETAAATAHTPMASPEATASTPIPSPRAAAPPPAPLVTASAPQRVDVARPVSAAGLTAAGTAGILGCPLPQGASLSGRSHGSDGIDDHPTETYAIDAPAQEIAGFYEREMERSGWHKTLVSSELLLYFVKGEETVGVLIDHEGGYFTLMGS
jgi:hypothetical protein